MNMKRLTTILSATAAFFLISTGSAQAAPIFIDFNLSDGEGYTQDSPVAEDYFASQDLILGSGTVTACGGACISTPSGDYKGTLIGDFINNDYNYLQFDSVMEAAVISLFDSADNLVTVIGSEDGYLYTGSTAIASFSADLQYDGFYSLTLDNATVREVPEPAILVLFGLGLVGLGFTSRKK